MSKFIKLDEDNPTGDIADHYEGLDVVLTDLMKEIEDRITNLHGHLWFGEFYVINLSTKRLHFYTDFISDDFTVDISLLEKEFTCKTSHIEEKS